MRGRGDEGCNVVPAVGHLHDVPTADGYGLALEFDAAEGLVEASRRVFLEDPRVHGGQTFSEQPRAQFNDERLSDALPLVLLQQVDRIQLAGVTRVVLTSGTAAHEPNDSVAVVLGDMCDLTVVCDQPAPDAFALPAVQ